MQVKQACDDEWAIYLKNVHKILYTTAQTQSTRESTANRQLTVLSKHGKKDKNEVTLSTMGKTAFSTDFICYTGICGPEETDSYYSEDECIWLKSKTNT